MLVGQRLGGDDQANNGAITNSSTNEITTHVDIKWHPSKDFLAVSSYISNGGGFVSFFTKRGGKSFYSSMIREGQSPICIGWHPLEALIAVGWDSGIASLVDPLKETDTQINGADGTVKVQRLGWSHSGDTLLIADEAGTLKAFECTIDARQMCRMKPLHTATLADNESPTDICSKLMDRHWSKGSTGATIAVAAIVEGGKDDFSKLLDRHHKRMEDFKEEPATLPAMAENISLFIIATSKGGVHIYDPHNELLVRIFQADSAIRQLLDVPSTPSNKRRPEKGKRAEVEVEALVLAITEGMMFYQLAINGPKADDRIKVKMTGHSQHFWMARIDASVIALCYGEREIRVWDLEKEDSAMLRLTAEKGYDLSAATNERIINLSYSSKKDTITAATSIGKIASWRRQQRNQAGTSSVPVEEQWRLQSAVVLGANVQHHNTIWALSNAFLLVKIKQLAWSHTVSGALAVSSGDAVQIFLSQLIDFFVGEEMSQQALSLIKLTDPIVEAQELQLHSNIRGFYVSGSSLLLWDEQKLQLDEIIAPAPSPKKGPLQINNVCTIDVSPTITHAFFFGQHIYYLEGDHLLIHTLKGTLKKTITFRESDGSPRLLDVRGKWLCLATSNGYLHIYDLSDVNPKLVFHSSQIGTSIDFHSFVSIKVNSNGTRVSFTIQSKNEEVYEKLLVWDAESDTVGYFSFHTGITDLQQHEMEAANTTGRGATSSKLKTAAGRRIEQQSDRYRMGQHLPGNHFWDRNDPRFLVCEAVHLSSSEHNQLLSMFVTSEQGIEMQDLQPCPAKADALISVAVPYIFFLKNIESDEEDERGVEQTITRLILRRTLREFVGVDPADKTAVEAMLNFSFYLSANKMDEAFKTIKYIRSENVWEQMAQMCVKSRRIEVARVCLGHMGNARAAHAIRRSVEKGESIDLQAARLAVELGMVEEAINILTGIGRWDMICQIHRARGRWEEAFLLSEKHDRIHLRHTHYNYAKYLESVGAIKEAIEGYEKANVHSFEVPRMLTTDPKLLEMYLTANQDPSLMNWWAQYLESNGEMETAKSFYHSARDYLSVVRILCYQRKPQEAFELIESTGDQAGAFHLGRHLEASEDYEGAVLCFERAGAYSNAIRLAKEHSMADKLANLALMAGGAELVEAAAYYEGIEGFADKAVMLYHKAGMIGRALDLAFSTEQFGALDLIAQELDEKSDPRVLERAAQFFSANQQDVKAVQLLAYAHKYKEAVALCEDKNVMLDETLDSLLTPPKTSKDRVELLEQIARCALQQSNYHLAAKKWAQAGNKIEAMRALLKSGDTSKVILFATTARSKDIYRMAGNYLQTLPWKEDAALMRQIEAFYLKAEAVDSIASFYEACAQVEIDEYKDYTKAMAAYSEALRCLNKAGEKDNADAKTAKRLVDMQERLRRDVEKIKSFIEARRLFESDPGEGMRQLEEIAKEKGINEVVRVGDIQAILILHNFKRANFKKALALVQKCEGEGIRIRNHIGEEVLNRILEENGISTQRAQNTNDGGEEGTIEYSYAMRRLSNYDGKGAEED